MKQRLTYYLIIFLLVLPVFCGAQKLVTGPASYITGVYEVKKKKETLLTIAAKLNADPQLISNLNDSTGINEKLPVGKRIVIPVFSSSGSHEATPEEGNLHLTPDTARSTGDRKKEGSQTTSGKHVIAEVVQKPAIDTDLIQNYILLTEATLDLNKALLQGIQASLDSLNVKDKNTADEKNIALSIRRMQRQRDKVILTPVLLHMQDSLKAEIKKEEDEKTSFENMLGRNESRLQKPETVVSTERAVKDAAPVAVNTVISDTVTKAIKIQATDKQNPRQDAESAAEGSLKADSTEFLPEKGHIRPVIEADGVNAVAVQAPVMHWETARALYFNDDTTGENQKGDGDTAAYTPGVNENRAMSDSSRLIRAQYFYTRSLKASNEKNFKAAVEYLRKAIDIAPEYYNAWFALGEADAHLGFYTKALNEFFHCKNLDSSKPSLYYKIGVVQLKLKQKAEAFGSFNQSLKRDSNYVPAIISRALEYADRGQFKTAIKEYNRVLQIDPSYHTVYKSRAMAEYSLKNYSTAIDDFTRFLIFNETDGSVFYYRGMAKVKTKDLMDACTDLSISARLGFPAALKAMQVNCK